VSGHSKFANIKHRKEKNDYKRGKIFTKLGREIAVAVKQGGSGDPEINSRLKDVVEKAKANNMPNDTIDRSIKKASGNMEGVNYERVVYEGYGPSGVAVIVDVLTDNRNRTAANVRSAFTKTGGNLGSTGCVSYMFKEVGQIMIEKNVAEEEILTDITLEAGADDIISEDEGFEIITAVESFSAVRNALEQNKIPVLSAQITRLPDTYQTLSDPDDIKKINRLLDALEEDDDVQDVYHNWEE
jgi:YebC/PmpR family DNA-binding regulatory protein